MELKNTRREQIAEFSALGIEGEAADLLDRLSGGPMHRFGWRVNETLRLMAEVDENVGEGAGILFLVADLIGVGGPAGVSGDGTARLAPFSSLGTGRKHATDGGSWMAAAAAALYEVGTGAGWRRRRLVLFADEFGAYLEVGDLRVGIDVLPAAWRVTVAANALRALVDGRDQLSLGDTGRIGHAVVPVKGTTANWACALNAALVAERVQLAPAAAVAETTFYEVAKDYGAIGEED